MAREITYRPNNADIPVGSTAVDTYPAGKCFVPDAFMPELNGLIASLDWSRVWNTSGDLCGWEHTARELEAAAKHARALADQCEEYARKAREIGPTDRRAPKFPRENRRADQQRENER